MIPSARDGERILEGKTPAVLRVGHVDTCSSQDIREQLAGI
jgi:hypothetical protein